MDKAVGCGAAWPHPSPGGHGLAPGDVGRPAVVGPPALPGITAVLAKVTAICRPPGPWQVLMEMGLARDRSDGLVGLQSPAGAGRGPSWPPSLTL